MGVGAVRDPLILGTAYEGGVHQSHFATSSLPDSKQVLNYCWVDRELQSSDDEARVRTPNLMPTLCILTESL